MKFTPRNPLVLSEIRKSRGYSLSQASSGSKINTARLREIENGEPFNTTELRSLSKTYAVPKFLFFNNIPPKLSERLPDFRTRGGTPMNLTPATVRAVQQATATRAFARRVLNEKSVEFELPELPSFEKAIGVVAFADLARDFIEIKDPREFRDDRQYLKHVRFQIENTGVICQFESFEANSQTGFCLSEGEGPPLIVVNTRKQSIRSRLFTLVHEFVHLLLRSDGISDPYGRASSDERFCNATAAAILAPEISFRSHVAHLIGSRKAEISDVHQIANRFKLSDQATAIRLQELGLSVPSLFQDLRAAQSEVSRDFSSKGGGGGSIDPGLTKLSKYGVTLARILDAGRQAEAISNFDLYRGIRLKPKYADQFFDAAHNRIEENTSTTSAEGA